MQSLESLTQSVCEIARQAGAYLKHERVSFRTDAVETKRAHDYVSYADRESERRVVTALRQLLPRAGFIAEEGSAGHDGQPLCWVVDPLDGTTNFVHNLSPYCVSIALRDARQLLLGVVFDPTLSECFCAWQGGGAWLNGQPIHVSPTATVDQALLGVELPYNAPAYAPTARRLLRSLYGRAAGIRMNGSAAMALCHVAAGRLDAWLEAFISPWDFSAGALLVQEAGGTVTNFRGASFLDGNNIVASNGPLHAPPAPAGRGNAAGGYLTF